MKMLEFLCGLEGINKDIHVECLWEETPLLFSISKHRLPMTKFLVENGANVNVVCPKTGFYALYTAAVQGTPDCLEYLLSLGLDINLRTKRKATALTKTAWLGRTDCLRLMLNHPKIDLEQKTQGFQATALQQACWGRGGTDRTGVKQCKLNPKDSPLIAEMLLSKGADPNNVDYYGKTALHIACQTKGTDCIPVLLKYGADVN